MTGPAFPRRRSYREATARARVAAILDVGTFREFLPPGNRVTSPHLASMGIPAAFDDGAIVGAGRLEGREVLVAAQEGAFLGGGVGEVHGAKITGLLRRARSERPSGVLLLADSGGVRLQEANAGLVGVSEVMREVLAARAEGVPVVALIGGAWGCFGGMGIVARCCTAVAMSEEGRLGISGPDVIETSRGVEELDASDRPLVWRTYGGKHRYLLGESDRLVEDDLAAFRAAALELLGLPRPIDLAALEREQALLASRLDALGDCTDARDAWLRSGVAEPDLLPLLDPSTFLRAAAGARRGDR